MAGALRVSDSRPRSAPDTSAESSKAGYGRPGPGGSRSACRAKPGEHRGIRSLPVYGTLEHTMRYERITLRPEQMGGQPCIRGLRIPVATVVAMVAEGMSHEESLAAYPDLEHADIGEALRYAAEAVRERELPLETVARGSSSTTPSHLLWRKVSAPPATMPFTCAITVCKPRPTRKSSIVQAPNPALSFRRTRTSGPCSQLANLSTVEADWPRVPSSCSTRLESACGDCPSAGDKTEPPGRDPGRARFPVEK
jgi:uncharacterized protein (DUF433 family)